AMVVLGPVAGAQAPPLPPSAAAMWAARPQHSRAASPYTSRVRPIAAYESGAGCVFAGRCAYAQQRCLDARPEPRQFGDHVVACHRTEELHGTLHKALERA